MNMKKLLGVGLVRGVLGGLAGTGAGLGITMLIRMGIGLPAWNAGPVWAGGIVAGVLGYLTALGIFSYWARWCVGAHDKIAIDEPGGSWMRFLSVSTDHKTIGIQYLATALMFLPIAVILQLVARLDMSKIGLSLSPETYTSLISDHGIVMLFIVAIPALRRADELFSCHCR